MYSLILIKEMNASQPSLGRRLVTNFADYLLARKKKLAIYSAVFLAMYVSYRRGYFRKLLEYLLNKAEERIEKTIARSNDELQEKMRMSEEFATSLKSFLDKFQSKYMIFVKRELDKQYNIESIKESLKAKGIQAAEKTKNWQNFKSAVNNSVVFVLASKAYLWNVWMIKDMVVSKSKKNVQKLIDSFKTTKETKFLSDSVASTLEFLNIFIDSLISNSIQEIHNNTNTFCKLLEWKLTDKVTIDSFIQRLSEIKDSLLQIDIHTKAHQENIDLQYKRLGLNKSTLNFKLVHKSKMKSSFSASGLLKACLRLLAPSPSNMISACLNQTIFSKMIFTRYKDYSIDLEGYSLMSYLLSETRRKSTSSLSPIVELDEHQEDKSGHVSDRDEQEARSQLIYEESSQLDGKDYDKQQLIIKSLEKFVYEFAKEFMDYLTCENTQLLAEINLEYNFKKLAARLELFKNFSKENSGELPYMKILTVVNKILEEEMVDKTSSKNDSQLYESRTKDLFLQLQRKSTDNPEQTCVNILVAEESKMYSMVQRATREYAARIYFEEEFEKYYGDKFDRPNNEKTSPAFIDNHNLAALMAKMNEMESSAMPQLESPLKGPF